VDHISIHLAFLIASAVSVALVVSYLRLVIGPRFAFREAAVAQFIYLVLFSYAFFFKGFTGLAITIGSISRCSPQCSSPVASAGARYSRASNRFGRALARILAALQV
jgi:hypothetical protein